MSEKLDSDWDDIDKLWADMKTFSETHPDHTIMSADDPGMNHIPPRAPRMGWVAFVKDAAEEDAKHWTIPITALKKTLRMGPNAEALKTATGRQALVDRLARGRKARS